MQINEEYLKKIKDLKFPERTENNEHMIFSCYGDDVRASSKFNVKVYNGKKGLKLITNDQHTLNCLINNIPTKPKKIERIISIDDSGVGFLLGGVLCGVYDSQTDEVKIAEIEVKHFHGESRAKKQYLNIYAKEAVKIVKELNPDKETTLIKICTGDVNVKAKEALRKLGFFVEVCEIKGKLQDDLEHIHKKYIADCFGYRGYVDPKECTCRELAIEFSRLKKWVIQNHKQKFCKENWGL